MRKGRYNFPSINGAANMISADLTFSASPAKAKAATPTILDYKTVTVQMPNQPAQKILVQTTPGVTTSQVQTAVQSSAKTTSPSTTPTDANKIIVTNPTPSLSDPQSQTASQVSQGRSGATSFTPESTPVTEGRSGATSFTPGNVDFSPIKTAPTIAPITFGDLDNVQQKTTAGSFAFTMPTNAIEWFGTIFIKGSLYYSVAIGVHGTTVGTIIFSVAILAMVTNIYKQKIKSLIKIN